MSGEINLRTFIKLASDSTENKLTIKQNGRIKISPRSGGRITNCFPFFSNKNHETKEAKFSYEVLKGVIQILNEGTFNNTTDKKVRKASEVIANKIEEQWDTLSTEEKDNFFDLPNRVSLDAVNSNELQEREGLDLLNTRIGNAIGVDLDRLIQKKALIIRMPDGKIVTPKNKNSESMSTLGEVLSNAFNIPLEVKDDFIEASRKQGGRNFDRFFGNITRNYTEEDLEALRPMQSFLTGISQSQYSHASTILTNLFQQTGRAKFSEGSHDNVLIGFNDDNTVEVRHYFNLSLKDNPEAVFRVDMAATFDLQEGKWISNSISFNAQDLENASKEVKKMHALLKKSGY